MSATDNKTSEEVFQEWFQYDSHSVYHVGLQTAHNSQLPSAALDLTTAIIGTDQFCKSLFTNNMVDDKKQREITEKLN